MELKEGYKQTEVGVIPSDWEVKKLGECLLKNPDYGINASAVPLFDALPTYIRITDISDDGLFIKNDNVSVNHPQAKLCFLEKGELVCLLGIASVGKTYLYNQEDGKLVFAGFLIRVRPRQKILDSKYLKFFTQTSLYWNWVGVNSMRSGQPGINGREYSQLPIPFPPTKAEQTAIAAVLSDADALIQSLEKLIGKKRNIKQGAMQELLKPKEGWVVKKLGKVGEIITGSTPPTEVKEYWNGNIPWITPTDISLKKDIFYSEREITLLGLKVIRKLPANALLVTCIASIGKNAILRRAGSCNQQINAIVPDSNNNIEFLYYLIENRNQYLLSKAGITATNIISKKDFTEITFSIPLLKEQTRIATILSDMDAEIAALEIKLEKYKQIKQGMMQELLTGRTRLV